MDDKTKSLVELIHHARTNRLGNPRIPANIIKAKLKAEDGGELEKIQCRITILEEQLATTTNTLYAFMAWTESYLRDN